MVTNGIRNPDRTWGARAAATSETWCARFVEQCRRRGVRITPQRSAVYRALAADATHPTAESVYDRVKAGMTTLSFATVYRILEFLEREGLIRKVSTTRGVTRYDANMAPHQHLVCRRCESMTDLNGESLGKLRLSAVAPAGFLVEEIEVRVVGLCPTCRRQRGHHGEKRRISAGMLSSRLDK